MAEFVNTIMTDDWEIETHNGWENIKGVGKTIIYREYLIKAREFSLIAADEHIIFDAKMNEKHVKDLTADNIIQTISGLRIIDAVVKTDVYSNMYDILMDDATDHAYYTNGILSHNSIWLCNIALNASAFGYNVFFASLEMSTHKIIKRMGVNAMNVPISDYTDYANQQNELEKNLNIYRRDNPTPMGKLQIKRFAHATADDIYIYARKEEERLGINFHLVIIDYFTELANSYGTSVEKSYTYHKQNNNDLYRIAVTTGWAVISAHQAKIGDYGAEDTTLNSISESSGLVHRTDNVFSIIQTPEMKALKKYYLKMLKLRDSEYGDYKIGFSIDYTHMRITELNEFIEPTENIHLYIHSKDGEPVDDVEENIDERNDVED